MKTYILTRTGEIPQVFHKYADGLKVIADYYKEDEKQMGGFLKHHVKERGYWVTGNNGQKVKVHIYKINTYQ